MRYKLFITIMLFCVLKVHAQETFIVRGVISRNISVERLAQVVITNIRSRDIMMSDELGWFSIKAAIGDTILFSKLNYTDLRVVITSKTDIPVYMQPVIQLGEVKIQGQTKRQEMSELMSDYRKQGIYYNGKPPVLSFLTSPLTGLYELFGKGPGQARRFAAYSKTEIEYAEVRRRYNIALVMRVTKADTTVARKFMNYYTPTFEDLKGWNDYELIKQIRKSYDYYDKSNEKEKLEELNQPTFIKPKQDQP